MVVLALLTEESMHAYRMHQLIRERAKDDVVNVGSRNSIHQVVQRLARDGLVTEQDVDSARGRTTYALTTAGESALRAWLADSLERSRNEYPEFPAALSFVAMLPPEQVTEHLERRVEQLRAEVAALRPEETARQYGLHRVFVVEDEYRRSMLEAELGWVERLVAELRDGTLRWTPPDGR